MPGTVEVTRLARSVRHLLAAKWIMTTWPEAGLAVAGRVTN
jgi:hypothetical protein